MWPVPIMDGGSELWDVVSGALLSPCNPQKRLCHGGETAKWRSRVVGRGGGVQRHLGAAHSLRLKGNAFLHHARLVSSPAGYGFQLQQGTGCLWICRAVVALEGALHFLLLGVSQPVYKKGSKGKALKGTSYSCVPFQLLIGFLFLCVPCRFYFSMLSLHSSTLFSCPVFLSPLGWESFGVSFQLCSCSVSGSASPRPTHGSGASCSVFSALDLSSWNLL